MTIWFDTKQCIQSFKCFAQDSCLDDVVRLHSIKLCLGLTCLQLIHALRTLSPHPVRFRDMLVLLVYCGLATVHGGKFFNNSLIFSCHCVVELLAVTNVVSSPPLGNETAEVPKYLFTSAWGRRQQGEQRHEHTHRAYCCPHGIS